MKAKRFVTGVMALAIMAGTAAPAAAVLPFSADTAVTASADSLQLTAKDIDTKLYAKLNDGKTVYLGAGHGDSFSVKEINTASYGVDKDNMKGFLLEVTLRELPDDKDATVTIGGNYNLYDSNGKNEFGFFARGGAVIKGGVRVYNCDIDISKKDVAKLDFYVEYKNFSVDDAEPAQKKSISDAKIKAASAVYTGKEVKPKVTVTLDGKTLKGGTDYALSYTQNIDPGFGRVIITGKGDYSGAVSTRFKIKPKAVTLKRVKSPKKKCLKAVWKKDKLVTGYQILIATDKKFSKNRKVVTIKKNAVTAKTVKGLKSRKKYYVKVRSYKEMYGKKVYSNFSKVKTVKVK